tara:strand:- start:1428 stop:1820 length:393 start_codon:yes stop_codon:yes gene_type:complete
MSVKTTAQSHVWWIKDGNLGIAKSSSDTDTDYISPEANLSVRIHFIKQDEDFIAGTSGSGIHMEESPAIPEEFHETLTHFAIARGYERKPELMNNAIYFRNLWQQELNKAKREADINKDGTPYFIQGYDF